MIGKVKAFDETKWLATIEFNAGFSDDDIRVRAVIDSSDSGIFIKPKIGSSVLCAQIEGKLESMVVLTWSDIEHVKFGKTKIDLNGDSFGGLVRIQELESNLNSLKTAIENLKTAISTGISAVGVGSAANGNTGSTAFNTAAAAIQIQFQDMENKKVKHGE